MAKKSISDIVLRAVVDTSGVAAGLNNVQAQVAGRRFGTVGGPQGATGAAGGFVSLEIMLKIVYFIIFKYYFVLYKD